MNRVSVNRGINSASSQPIHKPAPRTLLTSNNLPRTSSIAQVNNNIVALNAFEVKCLLLQIAYMESDSNIASVSGTRLGQYHTSEYLLEKYGYIDNTLTDIWTGLNGIDSQELFLEVPAVQNKLIIQFFNENYNKLIQANAIREGDTKPIVAGMLAVAYQFQDVQNSSTVQTNTIPSAVLTQIQSESSFNYNVIKAQIWRDNGQQVDSLGRSAELFFNAGKYAVQNLAADVVVT